MKKKNFLFFLTYKNLSRDDRPSKSTCLCCKPQNKQKISASLCSTRSSIPSVYVSTTKASLSVSLGRKKKKSVMYINVYVGRHRKETRWFYKLYSINNTVEVFSPPFQLPMMCLFHLYARYIYVLMEKTKYFMVARFVKKSM